MANKTDKLVVSNIKKTLFVIPYYQRGYRWTGKNVKQLLSDLLSFAREDDADDSEYCLQPIVLQDIPKNDYVHILKDEDTVIRVVDGQQRLTTIAIILRKLGIKTSWDIYYDTEKKRLSELLQSGSPSTSINDYFRNEVSVAVDEWFADNGKKMDIDLTNVFTDLFLSKSKRIAFLEYDIETINGEESGKEGHDAFLRLNDGKTPLTSSELIRALYMVRSSGLTIQQQMEISKEWEIIENTLRDNQFWLMFNARGLEGTPTRIDLLFALVLGVSLRETKANPRIVFDELEDEDKPYDLEKVWDEVLHVFWWMQSCYSDVELCNYLCWIRAYTDNSATTIYDYWRKYPAHKDFKDSIIKVIQETTFGGGKLASLEKVNYDWDKHELRKLFVLLNVLDCNKSKERFRFDLYNKCKGWDIEHIDSQTPNDFKSEKNKTEWLSDAWNELTKKQKELFISKFVLSQEVDMFDIKTLNLNEFESYANYIVELTSETDDKVPDRMKNSLGNLALLNFSINRSYKNDIFPLKRKTIIKHVNGGDEFIPPCTVKAFTKFYTKSASRITSWQYADFKGYYEDMNKNFTSFMECKVSVDDTGKANTATNLLKEKEEFAVSQKTGMKDSEPNNHNIPRFPDPIDFPTFMDNYDVIVPKIQRLYVQGRTDKNGSKCLSGFASSLVKSVSESSPLLLDFVYGIDTYGSSKCTFFPLDGQQRLTTLLLLSWLCGLSKPDWTFRYESRRSAEVFIKGLLGSNPPQLVKPKKYDEKKQSAKKNGKDYPSLCKDYICNLPWFHESWLSDIGICGMMEMLDSLYDKLLNTSSKPVFNMSFIKFLINYLDVNTKSYDHIFLKMNSRGRELTEWDNVNAVLDEFLPESLKRVWPDKIQLWYELMWHKMPSSGNNDSDKINRVDEKMLSVVELALDCSGYNDRSTNTFELSKWLQNKEDKEYFYNLCSTLFSALEIKPDDNLPHLIPNWTLSHKPRIPNFSCRENDVVVKLYQPLLVYYASVKSKNEMWIRVIWNLVENIDVKRDSFKQAIHLIDELSEGKDSILDYLCSIKIEDFKSCYQKAQCQLEEEIDKAVQIVNGTQPDDWDEEKQGTWTCWYDVIVTAESKRSFAGAIRFLYHDGLNNVNWSTFCTKWLHADAYFDNNGIKDVYAAKLVSALLKRCTKWIQVHDNFIFNKNDWKLPVLLNTLYAEPLDHILESPTLDVKVADFEENLVCERVIRDKLFEDKLIKVITSDYKDSRISGGRYFYGWRKHDGIFFDWRTDKEESEDWEHRRSLQIKSMLTASNGSMTVSNKKVSDEIYFGYTIYFKYNQMSFNWPNWPQDNVIYLKENDQSKPILEVTPTMNGEEILRKLQQEIEKRSHVI